MTLHGSCVGEVGQCFTQVEPGIVVGDECAFGIDVETRDYDVSFVLEIEAFDMDGVEEGLDVIRDVGARFFVEGIDNVFYCCLNFLPFPDGFDQVEDAVVVASGDVFDGEEEVWAGRVEFCYSEGDCLGGPNTSLGKGVDFFVGEVIDEKGGGGVSVASGFFRLDGGGDTDVVGLGDFSRGSEEFVADVAVSVEVVHLRTKGDGKEFPVGVVFPFYYEVDIYVVECGGGVGDVDFGHGGVSIFVERVTLGTFGRLGQGVAFFGSE